MKKKFVNSSSSFKYGFYVCMCFLFAGCSPHVFIQKPLDVSKANQSAAIHFNVKHEGNYRFAFIFLRATTRDEMRQQTLVWGDQNHAGTPIFSSLKIYRGEELIFHEDLMSIGTDSGGAILKGDQRLYGEARPIWELDLVEGDYIAEFQTLRDAPSFEKTESYVEVGYYNPKH